MQRQLLEGQRTIKDEGVKPIYHGFTPICMALNFKSCWKIKQLVGVEDLIVHQVLLTVYIS